MDSNLKLLRLILCSLFSVILTYDQSDYLIVYERTEVVRFNQDFLENVKTINFKYNRTHAATNYTGIFKRDFGNHAKIKVQAYKMASNEYRLFPITFEYSLCQAIERNDFGFAENLYKCGNFPKCPMVKGHYRYCYFTLDDKKFPPYMPEGSYRVDMQFLYFGAETQLLQGYGTVKRPIKIPDK